MALTLPRACLAAALVAGVAATVAPAHANDARRDVFALRHGAFSTHASLLGWTSDGRAAFRWLVCSEGGEPSCRAAVGTFAADGASDVTITLDVTSPDTIDARDASAFIRGEARAIAALPASTPTAPFADPAAAFGSVGGVPVSLETLRVPIPDSEPLSNHWLVARGPRGARVRLVPLGSSFSVNGLRVDGYPSPDGRRAALVVVADTTTMCWDFTTLDIRVVDVASVRARLANAAGMRAYRAGALREARARFVEATEADPEHALAWHNRACLASRAGDLDDAFESAGRAIALEPPIRARACADPDLDALRRTERGRALLACAD